jgi:coenzyme F420-dependent glucose-6-phosphate dehydrogenase
LRIGRRGRSEMTVIGFHASHEQFRPSELLRYVTRAERAGFQAASCSDHFHPWSERGGQSGFAWSWLGSALQATSLPLGVVNAPGGRYHPAIIAQAVATLLEMYPGRFWLAVGSGEFLNEHITGRPWPEKSVRHERLKEAVTIMRHLWAGETVTFEGHITCHEAKLYTLPDTAPLVVGAALTPETARWLGGWADGLITAGKDASDLTRVVDAFCEGGGEGKLLYLQVALAYAATDRDALADAHAQWRIAGLTPQELADIATPHEFDSRSALVTPETMRERIRVSADWRQHADWILRDVELGFDAIYLNHVGRNIDRFIDVCEEHLLPHVLDRRKLHP